MQNFTNFLIKTWGILRIHWKIMQKHINSFANPSQILILEAKTLYRIVLVVNTRLFKDLPTAQHHFLLEPKVIPNYHRRFQKISKCRKIILILKLFITFIWSILISSWPHPIRLPCMRLPIKENNKNNIIIEKLSDFTA